MSHLGTNFTAAKEFAAMADATFIADLAALNSSGVTGSVVASYIVEGDGSGYINVAVSAEGLEPGAHVQHIHGTFDGGGTPTDAMTPTLASDADGDGIIEVLEGVPSYGDVLMPVEDADDNPPVADADGRLYFVQSYDIEDMANFFSPVTSTQYAFADVMPLGLREYVIHGLTVPAGLGAGTGGEVDGSGGFTPILPAAAGEFEAASLSEVMDTLSDAQRDAGATTVLSNGDDTFLAGDGNDRVIGKMGNDTIAGGQDDDFILGNKGDDVIDGENGDDFIRGNSGADTIAGSGGMDDLGGGDGADEIYGGGGQDKIIGQVGDDRLFGDAGDDVIRGQKGDDLIVGGDGDDRLFGNNGRDIFGGLAGNDILKGGAGADEFHFDAGTGTDRIRDFTQGEDVISLLDGGAIDFANSDEDASGRGDSDLSEADFALILNIARLDAENDGQVVYSRSGYDDLANGTGAAVEAYIAGTNGTDTRLVYDDDWSDTAGREIIAELDGFNAAMTASDFDVY